MGRHFACHDFLEGHVLLGIVLSLIALLLLLLVTFATPFLTVLYFLHAESRRYGTFGLCFDGGGACERRLGYDTGPEITEWLTRTHILFPIGAIFMLSAIVFLVLSLARVPRYKWNPIYFRTTALLGSLASGLAVIFTMINFVQARRRYRAEGVDSDYGPSLWLGLGSSISAFLAACIGGPRITAGYMYRANQQVAYNV